MYSSQARIIKNYDYSAVGGDPAIPPLERQKTTSPIVNDRNKAKQQLRFD